MGQKHGSKDEKIQMNYSPPTHNNDVRCCSMVNGIGCLLRERIGQGYELSPLLSLSSSLLSLKLLLLLWWLWRLLLLLLLW